MTKTASKNRYLTLVLIAVAVGAAETLCAAPPSNDAFAAATVLSGSTVTATGNNAEATTDDVGEPFHTNDTIDRRTVWYRWTAPANGSLNVSLQGTAFTSQMLGVYVGSTARNLKTAEYDRGGIGTAQLDIPVVKDVTYHICVGAEGGVGGDLKISLNLTPSLPGAVSPLAAGADTSGAAFSLNDNFANAIALTGADVTAIGYGRDATTADAGEPFHNNDTIDRRTLWWKWTAPDSGWLNVSLQGTSFNSQMLGVYVGSTVRNLKTAEYARGGIGTAELSIPVVKNVVYYVCVGAEGGVSGPVQLNLKLTASLPGAVSPLAAGADTGETFTLNDNFANAIALTGVSVTAIGYNRDSTIADEGEPFQKLSSNNRRTVWWKWTAPESGHLRVSLQGTYFQYQMLGVYVGTTAANLKTVEYADAGSGFASLEVPVVAGVTYHLCVGAGTWWGASNGGPVQMTLTLTAGLEGAVSPLTADADIADETFTLNDSFAQAIALSGNEALAIGYNRDATANDLDEPFIRGSQQNHRTVWWKWTAPSSGTLRISLQGTDYEYNQLGVYVGSQPANLKRVSYSSSGVVADFASISAPVVAGVTYYLCVGDNPSYSGRGGPIQMNLSVSADLTGAVSPLEPDGDTSDLSFLLNDRFQNAVTLKGSRALGVGYHGDSTMNDIGEPFLEASGAGHTVWWKWTAPFDGTVELSMQGTTFGYQMLGLYTGPAPDKLTSLTEGRYVYELSGVATLSAAVKAGTTYHICVGSRQHNYNIWGNSILQLALTRAGGGGGDDGDDGVADNRTGISGTYHGYYETTTEAGVLSVRAKKTTITGYLLRGGQRIALRGTVGADGRAEMKSGNLMVVITMPASAQDSRLSAKLTETGKEEVSFELLPATKSAAVSGWQINTLLIAPDTSVGHGLASGKASAKGSIRFRGMLADGGKFSHTAPLVDSTSGLRCLVGAFVKASQGSIVGSLPLDASSGAVSGGATWVQQRSRTLGRAINSRLQVTGQRWVAPSAGTNILTGGREDAAFDLALLPGKKLTGRWPSTNKPVFEPVQDGASIKVRTKTGWISGMLPAEGGSASRFAALALPQTVTIGEGDETRAFKAGGFAVQGGTSVAIEISGQR